MRGSQLNQEPVKVACLQTWREEKGVEGSQMGTPPFFFFQCCLLPGSQVLSRTGGAGWAGTLGTKIPTDEGPGRSAPPWGWAYNPLGHSKESPTSFSFPLIFFILIFLLQPTFLFLEAFTPISASRFGVCGDRQRVGHISPHPTSFLFPTSRYCHTKWGSVLSSWTTSACSSLAFARTGSSLVRGEKGTALASSGPREIPSIVPTLQF